MDFGKDCCVGRLGWYVKASGSHRIVSLYKIKAPSYSSQILAWLQETCVFGRYDFLVLILRRENA